MDWFHPILVILYMILSFWAGMRVADHYNDAATQRQEMALQEQYARLRAGVDAHDPGKPYIGQDFMDTLRKNGRATTRLK